MTQEFLTNTLTDMFKRKVSVVLHTDHSAVFADGRTDTFKVNEEAVLLIRKNRTSHIPIEDVNYITEC